MSNTINIRGSRAQQFAARHEVFLSLWAEGMPTLEIGQQLGLSANQLKNHAIKAYDDKAPRKAPKYDCLIWEDLHPVLKKALPCTNEKAFVKVEVEDDGVILTLLAKPATAEEAVA
jgi:hypothetical protein